MEIGDQKDSSLWCCVWESDAYITVGIKVWGHVHFHGLPCLPSFIHCFFLLASGLRHFNFLYRLDRFTIFLLFVLIKLKLKHVYNLFLLIHNIYIDIIIPINNISPKVGYSLVIPNRLKWWSKGIVGIKIQRIFVHLHVLARFYSRHIFSLFPRSSIFSLIHSGF